MKILNERPKDNAYIYAVGKGDDTRIRIKYADNDPYLRYSNNMCLNLKEAYEFKEAFDKALKKAEELSLKKDKDEDEDDD